MHYAYSKIKGVFCYEFFKHLFDDAAHRNGQNVIVKRVEMKEEVVVTSFELESTPGHMAAIEERVTAALRSIPKEAFADSFQKLYERCQ
jgi:hypothetical protein